MKKKIISGAVLAVIFIVALVSFSFSLNRDADATTTDMGGAALPTISFDIDGYKVNPLSGYTKKMDVTTMRDTVMPLAVGTSLDADISGYSGKISTLTYEITTLDGKKSLKKEQIDNVKETVKLEFGKTLEDDEEKLLKVRLLLEDDREVYYYTRVVRAVNFNVPQCLDFAKEFHEKTMDPASFMELKKYLSREVLKKNKSLQHVTLESEITAIGWGELKPEIISDIQWEIKESNSTYTSILLQYKVQCADENGHNEIYNVNEFFKVRFLKGKATLEDYDRVMNQKFDGSEESFDKNGILLGYSSPDIPYMVNKDGDHISFIQERELWHFDSKNNEISMVFSFSNTEKEDLRAENDDHNVRLLDIEKNGNTVFAVYGYMNRGIHEGQVGVAVYYFDVEEGHTEEIAFISSTESGVMTADNFGKMIYYNKSQNTLYALISGTLYQVKLDSKDQKVLIENLSEGQYASSEDRKMLAYQSNGSLTEATEIEVWNLKTGKSYKVRSASDEIIRPLGFVGEDVIYGIGKKADIGKDVSGEQIIPLQRIEIQDEKNEVVKTYKSDNSYVINTSIEKNMVTLQRVQKDGDCYVGIAPDYITNNKQQDKDTISIDVYETQLKGKEVRLTDSKGLKEKAPKIMLPKQMLTERITTLSFETEKSNDPIYYVYGKGKFRGAFSNAGNAIALADELKGTVVTGKQTLLWERGNRMLRYSISDMEPFTKPDGESSLAACVDQILKFEKKEADVVSEMSKGKSAVEILNEHLKEEAVDLSGCTLEQLYYIINQGTPVIATIGSDSAILLTGYDDKMITYINPDTGKKPTESAEAVQAMIESNQGKFIGYVK